MYLKTYGISPIVVRFYTCKENQKEISCLIFSKFWGSQNGSVANKSYFIMNTIFKSKSLENPIGGSRKFEFYFLAHSLRSL